jgi:LysR family glycine cleavage system transcriptional activator
MLAKATSKRSAADRDGTLTISVAPSFASKWLLPRLAEFSRRHSDIELRILATVALSDLKRDEVDLAIRLGRGPYANTRTEALFGEGLTPLCAPSLMRGRGKIRTVDDLRKHRMLHDVSIPGDSERNSWLRWLEFAGASNIPHHRGARFSLAELAMQAAIDGAGIVLGRVVLAERDVAAGRLVRPFDTVMPLEEIYFLVMPEGPALRPEAQCFRDWLKASIGRRKSRNR